MPRKKPPQKKAQKPKAPARPFAGLGAEDVRRRIDVLGIIDALENHVLGTGKMTASQVAAALALLKKILPDLSPGGAKEKTGASSHEDALRDLEG